MNGERAYGKPVPNNIFPSVMNKVCNVWFKKWREKEGMTEEQFDQACDEVFDGIMREYEQYPFVSNLVVALIYELEARMHGGYTKATRSKTLQLIKSEGAVRYEQ